VKKSLILLTAALLASCAPLLSKVQSEPATLSTDGTAVLFNNPATDTAQNVSVALYGPVTVTGDGCHTYSKSWICAISSVPGGKAYRLQITGMLNNASASFYRAGGGGRPIYIQLK
jgi:hypothetical protein